MIKNVLIAIIGHLFLIIGFILAPLVFMFTAIHGHACYFSDKMMVDFYGDKGRVVEIKSNCCNASMSIKYGDKDSKKLYCSKCKKEVNPKDVF